MRFVAPALLGGLVVCAVAMVSALSGCRRDDALKIGYLGTLSGRHSDLGVAGRDGAVFAVEEINRSGGINGRPVELVVRDDQGEAEAAHKAVRELIDAKVAAIVGPMTSSMAMATVPLVNESPVVMVSPTVSSNDLTGKDDNFLRVFPPSGSTARHLATHVRQGLGLRRVAVIYDLSNRAHTEGWYRAFRSHFEALGGEVTESATFNAAVPADFLSLTGKLLATRPQGVFILAGAVDTAMICQQIRKSNPGVVLLASEWSSTPELIVHGGSAVEGLTYYQNVDRSDASPAFTAFRRAYHA
ncbi:amino acid ABC transporter substrate-binding protein, partial [bacterium]|nr:amino acid ABC transporter substrate-binding protein [bacterium]